MIDRVTDRFNLKPHRLAGDSAYGAAPMLAWLVKDKAIAPHIPVFDRSRRDDGTLSRPTSSSMPSRMPISVRKANC